MTDTFDGFERDDELDAATAGEKFAADSKRLDELLAAVRAPLVETEAAKPPEKEWRRLCGRGLSRSLIVTSKSKVYAAAIDSLNREAELAVLRLANQGLELAGGENGARVVVEEATEFDGVAIFLEAQVVPFKTGVPWRVGALPGLLLNMAKSRDEDMQEAVRKLTL